MIRAFTMAVITTLVTSSAGGQTLWQWQHPRPLGHALYAVGTIDDSRMVATGGLATWLTTTDQGDSWQWTTPSDGRGYLWQGVYVIDASHLISLGLNASYLSSDGGITWTRRPVADTSHGYTSMSFSDPKHGWISGPSGTMERTTDAGTTWEKPTTRTTAYCYGLHFTNAVRGWMAGASSTLRRTTDGGVTWDTVKTGLSGTLYTVSFVDDSVGWVAGGNGALIKTTDGGATWTNQITGLTNGTIQSMRFFNRMNGYIGPTVTSLGSLLRTTNGGATWSAENIGTTIVINRMLFTDADHGWIAGNGGAILSKIAGATAVKGADRPRTPAHIVLEQNFPNPFNPAADIRYQLSGTGSVRLTVYDVLGREVAVLVNERRSPGTYQVRFDARGLASGVYFYRLEVRPPDDGTGRDARDGTGASTETKRMLVIR